MLASVVALLLALVAPGLAASIDGSSLPASPYSRDCLLGCSPGQIINTASEKRIFDALSSVSDTGRRRQKCAIGVGNKGPHMLMRPRWYNYAGVIHTAAPYELAKSKSVLLLFTEQQYSLYGTEGVMSYDVGDTNYRVVIMWSVKADENWVNRFNLKVYPKSTEVDKTLFKQMFDVAGGWGAQDEDITNLQLRDEYGIKVTGHMTPGPVSRLTVAIDSAEFDDVTAKAKGPELQTDCQKQTLNGMRCTLECHPLGWCYTEAKCSTAADCHAENLACSSGC